MNRWPIPNTWGRQGWRSRGSLRNHRRLLGRFRIHRDTADGPSTDPTSNTTTGRMCFRIGSFHLGIGVQRFATSRTQPRVFPRPPQATRAQRLRASRPNQRSLRPCRPISANAPMTAMTAETTMKPGVSSLESVVSSAEEVEPPSPTTISPNMSRPMCGSQA